jgi:cold shock CspA family protein
MEGFKRLKAGQTVSLVQDEDEQGRTVAKEVTIIVEGEDE